MHNKRPFWKEEKKIRSGHFENLVKYVHTFKILQPFRKLLFLLI